MERDSERSSCAGRCDGECAHEVVLHAEAPHRRAREFAGVRDKRRPMWGQAPVRITERKRASRRFMPRRIARVTLQSIGDAVKPPRRRAHDYLIRWPSLRVG